MRGVARSFWTLVVVVGLVEGLLVSLAIRSLDHVLPCWWSPPKTPNASIASCGRAVAIFGHNSWVPGVAILAFVAASIIAAVVTLLCQVIGTNIALWHLNEPIPSPDRLISAEQVLGVKVLLIEDDRCFCCCAGLLAPRIIISTEMLSRLDDDELTAVLAHERAHAQRRDPARAVAVRVAASALFYLPLARHLANKALVASELGADASASSVSGKDALVGALLKVLGEVRPALGGATEMASLGALDARIEALRTERLPRVRPTVIVLLASLVGVAALYGLNAWLPPTSNRVVHSPSLHIINRRALASDGGGVTGTSDL